MREWHDCDVVYFRTISAINQKVFPVPLPFVSRMSPKQLLIMGLASMIAYVAYIAPAWHLAPIAILLVYVAAKERKALYPEKYLLSVLRFAVKRYLLCAPASMTERAMRDERRREHRHQGAGDLFVKPRRFSPSKGGPPGSAQAKVRKMYAAKLGTPISLEITIHDPIGLVYQRTRADVYFDGHHYAAVSDSNGQFEIYPIVTSFGRKELRVEVGGRTVVSEQFDIYQG